MLTCSKVLYVRPMFKGLIYSVDNLAKYSMEVKPKYCILF